MAPSQAICYAVCLLTAACNSSAYRAPARTNDGGVGDALTSTRQDAADDGGTVSQPDLEGKRDGRSNPPQDAGTEADADPGNPPDAATVLGPAATSCALPNPPPLELAPGDSSGVVFAREALPVFEVFITEEEWTTFCSNAAEMAETEDLPPLYVEASLMISGVPVERPVGFRARGESTLRSIFERPEAYERCLEWQFARKPSFKFKFNYADPADRWRGQKHINLLGPEGGGALLEEYLYSALAEELGLPAARVNHALLCVNNEYRGIFTLYEEADDRAFLGAHFEHPDGNYYKVGHSGDLTLPDDSPASFERRYEPVAGTDSITPLIEFLRFVNLPDNSAFAEGIASRIDLGNWLGLTALEMVLMDGDGAYNRNSNFLLYHDHDDPESVLGRWYLVRYDPDGILRDDEIVGWDDEARGSRLFCYYHYQAGDFNRIDGTAPPGDTPGFTVRDVQFSVLQARLLWWTHTEEYLSWVARVLEAMGGMDEFFDERLGFMAPWIEADPLMDGASGWRASVESLRRDAAAGLAAAERQYDRLIEAGTGSYYCSP